MRPVTAGAHICSPGQMLIEKGGGGRPGEPGVLKASLVLRLLWGILGVAFGCCCVQQGLPWGGREPHVLTQQAIAQTLVKPESARLLRLLFKKLLGI